MGLPGSEEGGRSGLLAPWSRGEFLAMVGAVLGASAWTSPLGAGPGLTLHGPAAGISALLGPVARRLGAEVALWRSIDELRAGLSAGRIQATLLPTYVAAGLAARGVDLALASVVTRGTLQLLAPGPLPDLRALRGRRVGLFLRHDLPDLVLTVLMRHAGLAEGDLARVYTAGAPEAIGLLLAGRLDAALVVEPVAAAALAKAQGTGRPLVRALDVNVAWDRATGRKGGIPQIGLAVAGSLREALPVLQAALQESVRMALAQPGPFLNQSPGGLGDPVALRAALPHMALDYRSATQARGDLEAFFRTLQGVNPRILSALPGPGFYR